MIEGMRGKGIGSVVALAVLLAACGSATPASSPTPPITPAPSVCPSPAPTDDPASSAAASPASAPCPPVGGANGGAGGPGGGPSGSIVVRWNESVTQTGLGTSSVITQSYVANIVVSLQGDDATGWTLTGHADITSAYTSDYLGQLADILGAPCTVHYTDNASGSGGVPVDGGLEASDGFYQFYVNVPGLDGTSDTVRDDSDCDGPNNRETVVWTVAPSTPGGSGEYIDPAHISGSASRPRTGGEDTITWSFTLP